MRPIQPTRLVTSAAVFIACCISVPCLVSQQPTTAPQPAPKPPITLQVKIDYPLTPAVKVAGCNANTGEGSCLNQGKWSMPSYLWEEGYRICDFVGGEDKLIVGQCDPWIYPSRREIGAKCWAANDGQIGGRGGHDNYNWGDVTLGLRIIVHRQCRDVATGPPEKDFPPPGEQFTQCDENGRAMCTRVVNGTSDGSSFPCDSKIPFKC